jgi:Domain of unknown function (DUF4200)
MSTASLSALLPIKSTSMISLTSDDEDLAAIKAVNNLIVTVENTSQIENNKETFLTQTGGKILETKGEDLRRSLQSTLLLQAKKQLKIVDLDLQEKRKDFVIRMARVRERRLELEERQKDVRDRVKKFERFIKDNAIKQARAKEKAKAERKIRKEKELENIKIQKDMVTSNLKLASMSKHISIIVDNFRGA